MHSAAGRLSELWCIPEPDKDLWLCGVVITGREVDVTEPLLSLLLPETVASAREVRLSVALVDQSLEIAQRGRLMTRVAISRSAAESILGLVRGETITETARRIGLSPTTVRNHRIHSAGRIRKWAIVNRQLRSL